MSVLTEVFYVWHSHSCDYADFGISSDGYLAKKDAEDEAKRLRDADEHDYTFTVRKMTVRL